MTLLSFGVSFASPLPGVGGSTKRQIPQEAHLAVCVRTAGALREESMGMGQFEVAWQMVDISLLGTSLSFVFKQSVELYPRLMELFMKGDKRETIFR